MKTTSLASLFMPESVLLPMLVLAGFLMIFGFRKVAGPLVVAVLIAAFSPLFEPVFEALFSTMPWWFAPMFFVGVLFLVAGRFMRDVLVHVLGDLIASAIKVTFHSPLTLMALIAVIGTSWVLMS